MSSRITYQDYLRHPLTKDQWQVTSRKTTILATDKLLIAEPGSVFGLQGVLQNRLLCCSYEAVGECEILSLPIPDLMTAANNKELERLADKIKQASNQEPTDRLETENPHSLCQVYFARHDKVVKERKTIASIKQKTGQPTLTGAKEPVETDRFVFSIKKLEKTYFTVSGTTTMNEVTRTQLKGTSAWHEGKH